MAGLIPGGHVVDPSKDIYPTSGVHIDPRVYPRFGPNKDKPINPRNAKFLLQNLLVGGKPVVEQRYGTWQWNFPITSEFGLRNTGIPGASTDHKGIDIAGMRAGTPIAYRGYGSYRPGGGYGTFSVTDAQGNPYDLRVLHTTPGTFAEVIAGTPPPAPILPPSEADLAKEAADKEKFLKNYIEKQFERAALNEMLNREKKDPFAEFQELMQAIPMGVMQNPLG